MLRIVTMTLICFWLNAGNFTLHGTVISKKNLVLSYNDDRFDIFLLFQDPVLRVLKLFKLSAFARVKLNKFGAATRNGRAVNHVLLCLPVRNISVRRNATTGPARLAIKLKRSTACVESRPSGFPALSYPGSVIRYKSYSNAYLYLIKSC